LRRPLLSQAKLLASYGEICLPRGRYITRLYDLAPRQHYYSSRSIGRRCTGACSTQGTSRESSVICSRPLLSAVSTLNSRKSRDLVVKNPKIVRIVRFLRYVRYAAVSDHGCMRKAAVFFPDVDAVLEISRKTHLKVSNVSYYFAEKLRSILISMSVCLSVSPLA